MEISKKVYDVQYSTYISNEIRNATGRDRSASIPYGCPVKGAGKTSTRLPANSHVLYSSNLVFTKYSLQAVALSACVHGPRSKLREYCRYCTCTFFASRRNYQLPTRVYYSPASVSHVALQDTTRPWGRKRVLLD